MNNAKQVEQLTAKLVEQVKNGAPLSEKAFELAMSCVGWPYVYSAWGALCTPSERRKRYGMTEKEAIKSKCKNFDGSGTCSGCTWLPGGERTRCYDCRGFTKWTLEQFGIIIKGDTCGSQWNNKDNWLTKGTIETLPDNVLCNVFIYNGTKFTHTGLAYNGATCECSNGVQYISPMKKNRWTHWAIARGVTDKVPEPTPGKRPTLRKGSTGVYVVECQSDLIKLGYDVGKSGADGIYGDKTVAAVKKFQSEHKGPDGKQLVSDGICGQNTWWSLDDAISAPVTEKRYTVTIPHLTKEQADSLVSQYPGATMAEERS